MNLTNGKYSYELPFEYINEYIVVSFRVNGSFPIKFIVDTGSKYTIITDKYIASLLGLKLESAFYLLGSDRSTPILSYISRGVTIQDDALLIRGQNILTLDEPFIQLDNIVGEGIYGILGTDFLKWFVAKFDYQQQKITLTLRTHFTPPRTYHTIPLHIIRGKPHIQAAINISGDTTLQAQLLLDSGASCYLMLHPNTYQHLHLPLPTQAIPSKIGFGMGGSLVGLLGYTQHLQIQTIQYHNLITHFQELPMLDDSLTTTHNDRNGLLGNQFLKYHTPIFNFADSVLYLAPLKKKPTVHYDKSGLILVAGGTFLQQITVHEVVPNSPAYQAGIQKNDQIIRINGSPTALMSIASITQKLQARSGKKIKITYRRNDIRYQTTFYLQGI